MKIEYSTSECMEGTTRRRMYLYEDDGDVIMTTEILYEVAEEEDDSECDYDGPVDDEEEEDSL